MDFRLILNNSCLYVDTTSSLLRVVMATSLLRVVSGPSRLANGLSRSVSLPKGSWKLSAL